MVGPDLYLEAYKFERLGLVYPLIVGDGTTTSMFEIANDLRYLNDEILAVTERVIAPDNPFIGLSPLRDSEAMQDIFMQYGRSEGPPENCNEMWEILISGENHVPDSWLSAKDHGSFYAPVQHPIINLIIVVDNRAGRRILFITKSGFVRAVSANISLTDLVAFIPKTTCPLELRPLFGGKYRINGFPYVGGLMNAELLDQYIDLCDIKMEVFKITWSRLGL